LTLTPKRGGEPVYRRTRYFELWSRQAHGGWKITKYIDNGDLPDTL
jgi:hypothetical protein